MCFFILPGKSSPLPYTEAMLLVCNHKAETRVRYIVTQQRMGADQQINLPTLQSIPDLAFFLWRHGTGQLFNTQAERGEQGTKGSGMLLGENFRRCQQCCDISVLCRSPRQSGGTERLPAAHISLQQAVHRLAGSHIYEGIGDSSPLGRSRGIGERRIKALQIRHLIAESLLLSMI